MYRSVFILLIGVTYYFSDGLGQAPLRYPHWRVIQKGDNPVWADPSYDHSEWSQLGYINSVGNYWVRFNILCDSLTESFAPTGLQVISTGSYELYWDGVKIGQNGIVGTSKETEIPGQFISQLLVPDTLLNPGIHTVAFRVSNYHAPNWGFPTWNQFYLEKYLSSQLNDLALAGWVFILAGIYLMTAIYYLLIFLLRKRESVTAIFSLICFLFFCLILLEYAKFYYLYPYHLHPIRLGIILFLNLAISLLMPVFFLLYFHIPFKKTLTLLLLLVQFGIVYFNLYNLDLINEIFGEVMWVNSLLILGYATFKRKKESSVMLAAVLLAGIMVSFFPVALSSMIHSYDVTLFLGFSILVLAMIYLLAKRSREQRLAYEASLLLSSRLQNELLKKNIQPHFIMNTLTSLMEWVEESPKESVQFIDALAGEFEIMSEIAEKKLIPLEQEIALCQQHISIMRYRKEVQYQFTHDSLPENRLIPPAIFHTVVENSLTHSLPKADNSLIIHLSFPQKPGFHGYELRTEAHNQPKEEIIEGTGLRYIRSRLMENYGEDWELESHGISEGWLTRIFIKAR